MIKEDKILAGFCIIILILSMVYFSAVKNDEKEIIEELDEEDIILNASRGYSSSGKTITAEALYNNLNDNFAGNDPFILSIRSEGDYAKGHIPGAVNIPFRRVFTEENLTKLPDNKQIVVNCYTGHTASQITSLLNVNGYDAVCLKWGISSWTTNSTLAGSRYDKSKHANDYQVTKGSEPGKWKSGTRCGGDETATETPKEETFSTDDKAEGIILKATSDYLASGKPPAIPATKLYENLNDGNEENNPLIISIRTADQYAKGHIPGAIHKSFGSLFTEENITWLNENTKNDRQIVVVCYTGHTASQATALLNINGYNATALKFAMTSWSNDPDVAPSGYDKSKDAHNYPIYIGVEPGDMENSVIADSYQVINSATNNFLNSGKGTMITAEALYNNLNDNYAGNDPFILSVRDSVKYAEGHIPGAVNIPWRSVFTEENILKLPTNKQIVVVCYTGHTASQVTAMLNIMGYDALCLKWGMCSWTSNTTIAPSCYDKETASHDYPVISGSNPTKTRSGTRQCGGDDPGGSGVQEQLTGTSNEIIRGSCNNYLNEKKPPAMSAESLNNNLNDGDESNNPFILSIRSSSQYEIGHISGAINIGFSNLFTTENLSKLPTDNQIVVVCYTGHTASQATALLNIHGYDAIALKFGMTSWSKNSTIAPSGYNRGKDCHNYPVFIGEEIGDLATANLADSGDVILTATNEFLNSGKSTMITAEALYNNLNDNYASNDPFILSIRSTEQYDNGHIPGAVNIPFRSVFTGENISKLPMNKKIVVVCYTGHTASQVTSMLNVMGYDAVCLKWGMCSWTTNKTIAPSCFDITKDTHDYPVETGQPTGGTRSSYSSSGGTRQCGGDEPGGGGDTDELTGSVSEIIRGACNNYLNEGKPPAMSAKALFDNLNDENSTDDPFVLSIRKSSHYEIGHIAGAINIGFSSLFTEENLSKLPNDKQIVVVCYTGHTASQATSLLNINGFDAIALKWGMTSWSINTTIAPSGYNRGKDCKNYPVYIGTEPGDMIGADIIGLTDSEIILDASRNYLEGGPKFIKAPALFDLLNDTNETNNPFILSIRGSSDYELGHIPTSINIPWRSLFSKENLSLLPDDDTQIVVVCYTGQSASQITALLNVLGYNASTLTHGMCSWNITIASKCFDDTTQQSDYPVSNGTEPGNIATASVRGCGDNGGGSGGIYDASSDEWEILRQACERYVNDVASMTITAKALLNNLNDSYTVNDPYIISIRSGEHYELGHVPGAVNIGAGGILEEDFFKALPQDEQIVVYCYTGQGAGHVSAILNINGFDCISLKFGMCSWTDNATLTANKCYNPITAGNDFKVSTGLEVGEW